MSNADAPARTLRRRFTLGSGPLKRTSDRVEFLSRLVLLLVLLAAAPAGLAVGSTASAGMRALAAEQATARQQESATLLADVPEDDRPGATHAAAPAVWTSPDGTNRTGDVNAPAGARAGSSLDIWVDRAGRLTDAPLTDSEVSGQGQVLGTLTFLGIVIAAMSGHLLLLCLLERRHHRQWERGWASVEPLWASRFR